MTLIIGKVIGWLFGTATGRYLLGAVAIGVVLFLAHKLYSNHYWSEGYAACKVEWDASIQATSNRVGDAVGRARDERVPDRFDTDR